MISMANYKTVAIVSHLLVISKVVPKIWALTNSAILSTEDPRTKPAS